jgi:hypothetical protein
VKPTIGMDSHTKDPSPWLSFRRLLSSSVLD